MRLDKSVDILQYGPKTPFQATFKYKTIFMRIALCYQAPYLLGALLCQFVFSQCDQAPKNSSSGQNTALAQTVDDLLKAADSLSSDALLARTTALPQPWQDSFFVKRLLVLENVENDNAIKQTLAVFKNTRPGDLLATGLEHYYYAIFCQYAGKFDSANIQYTQAIQDLDAAGAKFFLAQALDKHGGNLSTQGHGYDAIPLKYRAMALLDEIGDKGARIKVQMHLANVVNLKGDFDQVISLLEEPIAFYEAQKDSINLAYILAMKGTAFISKKEYQTALVLHKNALAMRQKIRAVSGITESLFHVGRTLLKLNQWQEALDTLRVAEKIIKTSTDKQGQAYIDAGIGEALFNLGRFEEAESYLTNSLDLSLKRKQYPPALLAAQRLSIVRRKQNRFAEALQYQDQFIAFKDSVFNQEKDKLSRELKVKYETREKELQIASLQRENRVATQRNWWIGGSLCLLMGIGFYTLRLRAERKVRQLANEQTMSEARVLLLQEQLEKQQLELAANRTRLDDYAQMLIDRNQQMAELTAQLLSEKPVSDSPQSPDEPWDLYRQTILTDADWEKFQQYFSEVFPGVITKLRVKYPSLTPVETRLILLDKMKLSLKETSTILGVSTEAIKKGRYRLRKKYNLNEDDLSLMVPND